MDALGAIKTFKKLQTELNGIKQGINFFKASPYWRLRNILEKEEQKIIIEINKLKNKLENIQIPD